LSQDKVGAGPPTPHQEYAGRRAERQRRSAELERRERGIAYARVAVFLAALAVAGFAFGAHALSGWWLVLPIVAFSALLVLHEKVTRSLHRAQRAVAFYDAGLARLEDAWRGQGQPGTRFHDEDHPYASDLDLFGPGSLFELLCTARTRTGEDTLAAWLKAPAGPDEVGARQAAVAELRPELDLREELALLGGDLPAGVDFHAVAEWGAAPPVLTAWWPRLVALALGALALVTLAGWLLSLFAFGEGTALGEFFARHGSDPFMVVLVLEGAFALWFYRRVRLVLEMVERRGRDLALLANVLKCLEQFTFTSPRLCELRNVLLSPDGHGPGAAPPSQRIAQLGNLLDLLNSRRNQLFAPIAYLLLWGTQMAHALEAWRAKSGPRIAAWLAVVGQFEALCALASYGYENPADPFPEVVAGDACCEGEGLGHPLLPAARCVRNDLHLSGGLRVLVVSGSNMSGKSTFLRTIGVNAVLALAGAPVRARRLRLSPLAVGATLRIQDSLQAGRSRFYAEVLRVRQVVEISRGPVPLLFLLDEIFAGTNSHDRRLGAEAVVRGLVEAGALGLVTTHDLALTHIADQLGPRAANVHFADHFEHGEMKFDYTLRPGVVQNSNALALMRAVGLRV
jgi:hypothetical protein